MKNNQLMGVNDIKSIAETFAKSGMFSDVKQMGQAFVKIQAGQEIGIPPFAAMSGIHIIKGKPVLGAGLIASTVKGSGKYDYKVKEMTDKKCSIDFYEGTEVIGNSTFTLEDAKKANTTNLEKFPKNMLFARAISNGVKWYCPDVFSGPVYTPGEIPEEETEDILHEDIKDENNFSTSEEYLKSASSLDELSEIWFSLSKNDKEELLVLKDELKEQLA